MGYENISKAVYDYRCSNPVNGSPMSLSTVANMIGVSRFTLGAWISGKRVPSLDGACKLAKLLGISLDKLLGV